MIFPKWDGGWAAIADWLTTVFWLAIWIVVIQLLLEGDRHWLAGAVILNTTIRFGTNCVEAWQTTARWVTRRRMVQFEAKARKHVLESKPGEFGEL